jgi:enamine deaminase RidA (YjgF/YER057c/UK114 family)
MKTKWEQIWAQIEKTEKELNTFLETAGLSTIALCKSKPFVKQWNDLKKSACDFDKYILVEPDEIVFPFHSQGLNDMWKRWKEYLSEQHAQLMRTRAEKSAVEYLMEISNEDEERAIKYLRYAMANRYKIFFAIDEKTTKQPAEDFANMSQ